ncbi:uncharacterized protein LOC113546123 isoform X1 [Pangasianodon hypophthalmus]|uniref:uncharacterized protein LOC113546123 isoform X1 n=1 Tax=Pangasianodon hypophthalmus TaxID=310915 RepID=UPI0023081601|nr:uncharacterized protein LOC113546123 isoform X1 [Pangasianodon hypophthalmus]XP_034162698.2 uncharacterized protein LOC113546123 isoform X1 [Pangasianodon hypophthalmus]
MGKISVRRRSKKRRSNSIQSEEVSPVNVKEESEIPENSFSEPRPNQPAGFNVSTPSTPTSVSFNTSAVDRSHVISPGFCHNNVGQLTINNNVVIGPDTRERKHVNQDGVSDIDTSTTTILRTPKKSKKSRRSRCSAARRSLVPFCREHAIVGEITGALVTSEYHCSECSFKIPSWKPPRFRVRCPRCKMSWRCDKVQCTCKAKITLEQPSGQTQRVTLDDSLLRSIVRFKQHGYCKTESIENKVLKVGSVKVVYDDGVVRSVTKISSGSMSLPDMPDDLPRDSD